MSYSASKQQSQLKNGSNRTNPTNAQHVMAAPPPPQNAGAPATAPTYSMASLYVGDLHPEVTESMLFEKFSAAGPVLSIRVCRDNASRMSLGYAYVNFQQPADAERALDTMNFETMLDKQMRIMWSQRDPAARRSGNCNIFIKNLDKDIDNKSIYDTFSLFGNIASCKVAVDEEGISRGYGFVHFENESSALNAIEKVNGMLLSGKKVYVGKFQSRGQRLREFGDTGRKFTNVFVKNFGDNLDDEKLVKLFEKFGTISSATVMKDAAGKPKGFGFVAYAEAEDAAKAVEEMNDQILEGTELKLLVCRAQKKSERSSELKRAYEAKKQERIQRYQGVNLYVKNLEENVNDEELKKHFDSFGTITSAKVMTDENGRSKGFGFVCFEKPEEATNAVTEMNSKMVGTKPLYVALAQRKEDRKAQLASQYMQKLATLRMHPGAVPNMYPNAQGGFFVTNTIPAQTRFQPMRGAPNVGNRPGNMYPNQPLIVQYPQVNNNRNVYAQGVHRNQPPRPQYNMGPRNNMQGPPRGGPPMQGMPPMHMRQGPPPQQQQPRGGQPQAPQQPAQQPQQQKQYYGNQGRSGPPQSAQSGIVISGQEPLTSHMLAQAAPQEQKQLLGERIYAQIEKMFPGHKDAGKITGMMLEIDNSELIMMLQDEELFRSKVDEASAVLNTAAQ
ncbi:unnamed protein product [Caenorhabditis angaria]|uniref:Polyadenylate-binding protein n=1 Tax=Caenorhabditis angaria TaxID=860376 RepID=A0A9P1N853_9PELO|nr:unnamed protein product [Caenorhabditis angaria]